MSVRYDNQLPEVLKPSEKPLDFPAALIPPQLSAILSFRLRPVAAMRRAYLDGIFFQFFFVKSVAVICFVANEFFRLSGKEKAAQHRFRDASPHAAKYLQCRR